jgi:DNA adenine methylase
MKNSQDVVKTTKMTSPITYWGGKKLMVRHILPLIPTHEIYVEPFFGGGAVYFAKQPSKVEIINDINRFVINFFSQIKTNFEKLQAKIQCTPFSRAIYKDALVMYENPHLFEDVEKAWAFWVLCNQGFAGKVGTWGYGTIDNKRELSTQNKREGFLDSFMKRLEMTQIECDNALKIIRLRDRPQAFFYVDPPYIDSAQGHYSGYTTEDYTELLTTLSKIEGKFLLSSYPSNVLEKFTKEHGWYQIQYKQATLASRYRKEKTEVLTANYPISQSEILQN